jgi:hypothetical protein
LYGRQNGAESIENKIKMTVRGSQNQNDKVEINRIKIIF